jgi:hypothetical protein
MKDIKEDSHGLEYTFYTPEDIKRRFAKLRDLCKDKLNHTEIESLIKEIIGNRILLAQMLDHKDEEYLIYRVVTNYEKIKLDLPSSFSYNPQPTIGRANLAKYPVFYGALSPATAIKELDIDLGVGDTFYLSVWNLTFEQPIIAHSLIINDVTLEDGNIFSTLVKSHLKKLESFFERLPSEHKDGVKELCLQLGNMFTTKGTDYYNVTSTYAHDVLYKAMEEQGVNMPIILYPSVASDHHGINLAIHPRLVESDQMNLLKIIKFEKTCSFNEEGRVQVKKIASGFPNKGQIQWYTSYFDVDEIVYDNIVVEMYNGGTLCGTEALTRKVLEGDVTFGELLKTQLTTLIRDTINKKHKQNDNDDMSNISNIRCLFTLDFPHGIQLDGIDGESCVKKISVPVFYSEKFSPIKG